MEEVDSDEEVGVQAYGANGVGWAGLAVVPPRAAPGYVLELIRGMSEEDQATFKRNYGPYGGDDVSSLEGDKPQVGVHGQDMTETPCLFFSSFCFSVESNFCFLMGWGGSLASLDWSC